ncbi:MAG: hypothetical protein AB8B83_00460 [Bdellovibrionales bacterium]
MQKVSIYTNSRESYIKVFHELDRLLQRFCPDQQTTLDLNGDEDSGKSLGAIAMHFSRVNKTAKALQIPNKDTVTGDFDLSESRSGQVVFKNFKRDIHTSKESYDRTLQDFAERNPQAKIIVAANLCRTLMGDYNYEAYGLNSDRLDIGVLVHMSKMSQKLINEEDQSALSTFFDGFMRLFNHKTKTLNAHEREEAWREAFWRRIDIFLPDDHPITKSVLALKDSLAIDTSVKPAL